MQHAKVSNSPEKRMKGAELKRLRQGASLTMVELAEKMYSWGWDSKKVWRFQCKPLFYLDPSEMSDLLTALDATSL